MYSSWLAIEIGRGLFQALKVESVAPKANKGWKWGWQHGEDSGSRREEQEKRREKEKGSSRLLVVV
jgi:hypothetical protein